jgi:hypothetical protein
MYLRHINTNIKSKMKRGIFVCLIQHRVMKTYFAVELQLHVFFLTVVLHEGE